MVILDEEFENLWKLNQKLEKKDKTLNTSEYCPKLTKYFFNHLILNILIQPINIVILKMVLYFKENKKLKNLSI